MPLPPRFFSASEAYPSARARVCSVKLPSEFVLLIVITSEALIAAIVLVPVTPRVPGMVTPVEIAVSQEVPAAVPIKLFIVKL